MRSTHLIMWQRISHRSRLSAVRVLLKLYFQSLTLTCDEVFFSSCIVLYLNKGSECFTAKESDEVTKKLDRKLTTNTSETFQRRMFLQFLHAGRHKIPYQWANETFQRSSNWWNLEGESSLIFKKRRGGDYVLLCEGGFSQFHFHDGFSRALTVTLRNVQVIGHGGCLHF